MLKTAIWERYEREDSIMPGALYLRNQETGQDWYDFLTEKEAYLKGKQFAIVTPDNLVCLVTGDLTLYSPEHNRVVEIRNVDVPEDVMESVYRLTDSGFEWVRERRRPAPSSTEMQAVRLIDKARNAMLRAISVGNAGDVEALKQYITQLGQVDLTAAEITWPAFDWESLE